MSWRLLAVLLLWPWAALAHQSGNSYLRIHHGATALSVQIEFPVKDLGALLQDPSLGPAPTREQLAQQQLPLAHAIAGSLMIEVIFSLDGLGRMSYDAAVSRDYPVVFGSLFIFTLFGLLIRLIGDICYTLVDPRIDFSTRAH